MVGIKIEGEPFSYTILLPKIEYEVRIYQKVHGFYDIKEIHHKYILSHVGGVTFFLQGRPPQTPPRPWCPPRLVEGSLEGAPSQNLLET